MWVRFMGNLTESRVCYDVHYLRIFRLSGTEVFSIELRGGKHEKITSSLMGNLDWIFHFLFFLIFQMVPWSTVMATANITRATVTQIHACKRRSIKFQQSHVPDRQLMRWLHLVALRCMVMEDNSMAYFRVAQTAYMKISTFHPLREHWREKRMSSGCDRM